MASRRHIRRKQCEGKVRHETAQEAGTASWKAKQKWGDSMYPYKCSNCHGWHIGHMSFRIRLKIG